MQERVWVSSESWSDSGKQNQTSEPKIPSWVFSISASAEFQGLVYIGKPWLLAPKGSISQNGWQMEKIIKFHPVFCTIKIDSRHNGLTLNFAGQRHIKIKREAAFRSWVIYQHTNSVKLGCRGQSHHKVQAEHVVIALMIFLAQIEDAKLAMRNKLTWILWDYPKPHDSSKNNNHLLFEELLKCVEI